MKIRGWFQAASTPGSLVSLLPGVVPQTPVETIVAGRLAGGPPVRFPALVDWLAGRFLAEHRGDPTSWVLDIGLWGPWVFRREAAGALEALVGRFLKIEEERGEESRRPGLRGADRLDGTEGPRRSRAAPMGER